MSSCICEADTVGDICESSGHILNLESFVDRIEMFDKYELQWLVGSGIMALTNIPTPFLLRRRIPLSNPSNNNTPTGEVISFISWNQVLLSLDAGVVAVVLPVLGGGGT